MDFNNLYSYATLIQLISAVNFAYIFSRFHQRVYRLIFNEKKLINDKFVSFINDITVDMESLQSMEPIETTKGTSNANSLDEIKNEFNELRDLWDNQKEKMTKTLQKVKSVKGGRSLFLFVSLFCLLDLFCIATCYWCDNGFWVQFAIIFYGLSIIVPVILSLFIIFFRWSNVSEVYCYKWTSWAFIITVIVSLILVALNCWWIKLDILQPLIYKIAFVIAIVMPFYACVFSILYIACYGMRFGYLAGSDTKELRKKQKELHQKKIKLDESYDMFCEIPPAFG